MSKSIKRIALVAVSALGASFLASAPTQAADTVTVTSGLPLYVSAASYSSDGTGSWGTRTVTTAAAVTVSQVAGVNNYVEITAAGDSSAASIITVSGGTILSQIQAAGTSPAVGTLNAAATEISYSNTNLEDTTDAAFKIATPTAGTITAKIITRAFSGGVATDTTVQTFTITVTSAAVSNVYSAANSTVYAAGHASDAGATTPDSTTDATATSTPWTFSASAANSAEAMKIVVDQEDANDVNLSTAVANTVSITGVGAVGLATGTPLGSYAAETAQGSDFYIFADGRSGVSTITVSVNGAVVKTYTITFFGAAASYKQTASKTNIGVGETGTLTAESYDAAGIKVSATPTVYAVSSNTAVATVSVSTNVVTVTGVASGSADISICDTSACTSAVVKLVVPVTITKTTAKSVTITFDKDEYAPGELMTIYINAKDSNGAGTADATRSLLSSTGVTSSVALAASTLPTTASVALVGGKGTYTAYAPLVTGTIKLTATEGTATDNVTAGGTAASITASVNVVASASTSDAIDAANEATDAANAATDAANAAAEAADAATAAAQDAQAAVAALATQVASLIAGIKAQITTLTNLVIKIQKKVKA